MVNGYDKESFDSKMIWPASAPVQKEDKLWIYYSGFANTHNAVESEHTGQIGLAHLRLDGFCSLDATSEGFVITRALKFQGSHLFVNAEVNAIELQSSGSHPAWAKIFAGAGPEGYVPSRDTQPRSAPRCAGTESNSRYHGVEVKVWTP
jgi:hypothetical protein